MRKKRNLSGGLFRCLFLVIVLAAAFAATSLAAGKRQQGSITVQVLAENQEGSHVPVPGVRFEVYKVAEAGEDRWTWTPPYDGLNLPLDFENTESLERSAKEVYQYLAENQLREEGEATGADGTVRFETETGIYLIAQTGIFEWQTKEYVSSPVLIAMPSLIDGYEVLDVWMNPKFQITVPGKPAPPSGSGGGGGLNETFTEIEGGYINNNQDSAALADGAGEESGGGGGRIYRSVETGDKTTVVVYVALMIISLTGMLWILRLWKKKR